MDADSQDQTKDDLHSALQDRWNGRMAKLLDPGPEQVEKLFAGGCPTCLEIGSKWVHLRLCLKCSQINCCDSSPQTHAWFHWQESGHAVMRTIEPDEDWKWNYELNGYVT